MHQFSKKVLSLLGGLLIFQITLAQNAIVIKLGTGVVNYAGITGIGSDNEILFSFNNYLSYGVNLGFAMSSDQKPPLESSGSYLQQAVYCGDASLYFNPSIYKDFNLIVSASYGVRHLNATQILQNSNAEFTTSNEFSTGFGFKSGLGATYTFKNKYVVGITYKRDFYQDGFDYFGIQFGIKLP